VTHLAFFSVVAVVPLLLVKRLHADESFMAWFGLVELMSGAFIAYFMDRLINKVGARPVIAVAMGGTMIATLIFMVAQALPVTLVGAAISGASWSAASVGVLGFFFQSMPSEHVQKATVAYQQVVALGLFVGPMLGSTLANSGMNLAVVLGIGATLRLSAAMLTYFDLPTLDRKRQLA
jgi:MFS family permease